MSILLCIDGTGALAGADYRRGMAHSFVRRIHWHTNASPKRYLRGPFFDGLDMAWIASTGYDWVVAARAASPNASILLTGYSRGGAGVIEVAQRLKKDDVTVDAMVLFDAVDRTARLSSFQDIPNNVRRVIHAMRRDDTLSRSSFGHCGYNFRHPTVYRQEHFWATHGGMGGVPASLPIPLIPHPPPMAESTVSRELREYFVAHPNTDHSWEARARREMWHVRTGRPNEPGENRPNERGELTPTVVTFDEDAIGAAAVWAWVLPFLYKQGFWG